MIPRSELRESRQGREEEGKGEREGENLPLITSWVTAPAGRCQNPTISDMRKALRNEDEAILWERGGKWEQEEGWDALKGEKIGNIDYNINEDRSVGGYDRKKWREYNVLGSNIGTD